MIYEQSSAVVIQLNAVVIANIFKDLQADDKHGNLHRRKKDWLGKWTEANIIRDRLYKDILEAQKKPST